MADGQRARDSDNVARWAKTEGVDLESKAEWAKQKLRNVDRARS